MANETGSLMTSAPFLGHHKETGTVLNIMLQLFPLRSSCSKLPAAPALAVSLQVPRSPASRIFHTATLGMTMWHREHPRGGRAKAALV